MAKMVKVEEKKETTKKKANIDLSKIGKVINENSDTIQMVATTLLSSAAKNNSTKKSTNRKSSKRTTKSKSTKSSDSLSTAIGLFSNLLKK